jgi:hypothetical protein
LTGKCTASLALPTCGRQVGGVKGHNINKISFPGSPALWAGSFINNIFLGVDIYLIRVKIRLLLNFRVLFVDQY